VTYSCAYCGAAASPEAGCATCGRDPDPDAVEVARCDAEITALIGHLATARRAVDDLDERIGHLATARRAVDDLDERIGHVWERRNAADARVRAAARPRRHRLGVLTYPLGGVVATAAAVLPGDPRVRAAVLAATAALPLGAALRRHPPASASATRGWLSRGRTGR
jgi:hypothetical protein